MRKLFIICLAVLVVESASAFDEDYFKAENTIIYTVENAIEVHEIEVVFLGDRALVKYEGNDEVIPLQIP